MHSPAMQTLIALLIVAGCSAYAVWTLMPQAWRGALQRRLTGRAAAPASGCGSCGGCDSKPSAKVGAVAGTSVIRLQRRLPIKASAASANPGGNDSNQH